MSDHQLQLPMKPPKEEEKEKYSFPFFGVLGAKEDI